MQTMRDTPYEDHRDPHEWSVLGADRGAAERWFRIASLAEQGDAADFGCADEQGVEEKKGESPEMAAE